ncbi:MAG TPA: FCD domain-containing protein, partial [Caldimonas sp.]
TVPLFSDLARDGDAKRIVELFTSPSIIGKPTVVGPRVPAAQVAALRKALRAIDNSAAEARDGVDEDLAFHRLLAQTSGNPHFGRLLEFLEQYTREAMRVTRRNDATRADFVEAVRAEHAAIVEAIAAGDAALARRRALQHMRGGDRRMRSVAPAGAKTRSARK